MPEEAYQSFLKKGYIAGDGRRVWKSFRRPYLWMIREMIKRIGPSPIRSQYPVWFWFQWDKNKVKPDLRHSGHLMKGTKAVRLTCLLELSDVVLSDFDDWHCVLNNWYCGDDDADWDRWNAELESQGIDPHSGGHWENPNPLPEEYDRRRQASWQKIFDLNRSQVNTIQGTTWKIDRSQVIETTPFVAR